MRVYTNTSTRMCGSPVLPRRARARYSMGRSRRGDNLGAGAAFGACHDRDRRHVCLFVWLATLVGLGQGLLFFPVEAAGRPPTQIGPDDIRGRRDPDPKHATPPRGPCSRKRAVFEPLPYAFDLGVFKLLAVTTRCLSWFEFFFVMYVTTLIKYEACLIAQRKKKHLSERTPVLPGFPPGEVLKHMGISIWSGYAALGTLLLIEN